MEAYFEFIEKISINEIINYDFNLESNLIAPIVRIRAFTFVLNVSISIITSVICVY